MALTFIRPHLQQSPSAPENTDAPAISVSLEGVWSSLSFWLENTTAQIMSWGFVWQLLAVLAAALLAYIAARYPRARLDHAADARPAADIVYRLYKSLARILWPAFMVVLLWTCTIAFNALDLTNGGLRIAASLLNAWIIVRLVTSNMKQGFWSGFIAVTSWSVAALYILRLLTPVSGWLDAQVIQIGSLRLSALKLITSIIIAVIALWAGRLAGDTAQSQLRGSKSLTPSMAGLLGQALKIGFMVIAVIIALDSVGINLTALAVFTGALGVGIGFGLQAIFSNFISGVIILFEKSVKVGDFIELQSGVNGLVREINIRSTLVTTNDNVDILVPNEEFIKAQVTNWTLRDTLRRLRIPFGVAYGADKEIVRQAVLEAAATVEWTYTRESHRAPQVWLVNFGDSSLDFELVVWLTDDAVKKPARVQADYYWAIHTALEKYNIEIPFPQRDINIKQPAELRVSLLREEE